MDVAGVHCIYVGGTLQTLARIHIDIIIHCGAPLMMLDSETFGTFGTRYFPRIPAIHRLGEILRLLAIKCPSHHSINRLILETTHTVQHALGSPVDRRSG